MKRVSVLLAVHNGAPFIASAIQSVIEQTYPHWELIVVSNGSTDATVDICRRSSGADSRIRLFTLPEKGKNNAYNFAYQQATGEYLCFFAADDILPPESLVERLHALEGRPASWYSTCCLRTFSADPKYDGIAFPRNPTQPNYSGGCLFFSRDLADRVFPLPTTQPNEDTWASLHLRAFGENQHIGKPLYWYRIHRDNSYGYDLSFAQKRQQYLLRMHAYPLFYEKYRDTRTPFLEREVLPFLEGLNAAKENNVLRLLLVRRLNLGSKMMLAFYCSRLLYGIRHLFFRTLSRGRVT